MKKGLPARVSAWIWGCFFSALILAGTTFVLIPHSHAEPGPPSDIGPPDAMKATETSDFGTRKVESKGWFQRNVTDSGLVIQFKKGGFIMYFILACSIGGVYIFLERTYSLRKKEMLPPEFLDKILNELPDNNIDIMEERKIVKSLVDLCGAKDIPLSRSLRAGLLVHTEGFGEVRAVITSVNEREGVLMAKGVPILGLLSNIAPLLGLLGTVTGMIKAFDMLSAAGAGKPEVVAAGISEALVTTAGGLFVGIPLLLLFNLLQTKIDNITLDIEEFALEVIEGIIYRESEGNA